MGAGAVPFTGNGVVARGRAAAAAAEDDAEEALLAGAAVAEGTGVDTDARRPLLGAGAEAETEVAAAVLTAGMSRSCEEDRDIDDAADRLLSRDKSTIQYNDKKLRKKVKQHSNM